MERRRLRNEELNDLHSQNIIRVISKKMIWAGHIALMGERRVSNSVLVRKPEGKRLLGKPMLR